MNKVVIAFDVDGTLRKNSEEIHRTEIVENTGIIELLFMLANFKNVEIHIWSNRGKEYCEMIRLEFHLQKAVKLNNCHKKTWLAESSDFVPDIAIDDQQRFDGGMINLIVREK